MPRRARSSRTVVQWSPATWASAASVIVPSRHASRCGQRIGVGTYGARRTTARSAGGVRALMALHRSALPARRFAGRRGRELARLGVGKKLLQPLGVLVRIEADLLFEGTVLFKIPP